MVYTFFMLLLVHIAIALSSIGLTGITYLSPSKTKLQMSYGMIAGTFITGTLLIILSPSHLMSACISGLIYLGIVSVGIYSARHKLAKQVDHA